MGTIDDATAIFQVRSPELDIFVIVIILVDTPFDPKSNSFKNSTFAVQSYRSMTSLMSQKRRQGQRCRIITPVLPCRLILRPSYCLLSLALCWCLPPFKAHQSKLFNCELLTLGISNALVSPTVLACFC